MRIFLTLCLFTLLFYSCKKDNVSNPPLNGCDIQNVYADNAKKVTITRGVWGTVSLAEGDCMPSIPYNPCRIRHCPVRRTVRIYDYSKADNTVPYNPYGPFFDSLNTRFVAQVETGENGFFQADIAPGQYSIFMVENGKLYADNNKRDNQGGLCPFSFASGTITVNLLLNYVTY